ncbi:DUF4062 domain-containing protein [uncultured Clostridium sp.]|uniref:DUF4062 domain-containing protein n=1 Tax=uncultured Clostridium sp. TaxID=59620 RepID=UPI0025DBDBC4|nr:DUF4062 domain-containing protein [uncultured Clostridium sp.]MDU2489648.1 DUF4062 domain-containing protein [Clostridium celatum]MDU4882980.1 DUF4062 domain-containing protein [Clostridium celatum]MDU7076119.1 DUF4062 domain-containing protein [Clostridium celatum]
MAKKKLQIFISSTFTDLVEERQAAVEAILGSRHIPAGMELFKAGNKSQLETIKKWIDESDLYMLILGGRYGSIEPDTGKSYTQIEYEYAIEKNIPVFAVVLTDSFLYKKASMKAYEVFEKENETKYNDFKAYVMSKIIKEVDDCKDIKIAIKDSIVELEEDYELNGWIKASEIDADNELLEENRNLLKENSKLLKENNNLKEKLDKFILEDKIGKYNYNDLKSKLLNEEVVLSAKYFTELEEDITSNYFETFMKVKDDFIIGIENKVGMDLYDKFLYFRFAPYLITFGLLEINKVAGVKYRRCEMTKQGLEFIARVELENMSK